MKKLFNALLVGSFLIIGWSGPAQPAFIPGDVASAGLEYIVPDMLVWYSMDQLPGQPYQGYVTNGPVDTIVQLGNVSLNNGNWEPYLSVLGESTFLVEAGTFADDGSWQDPGAWGGRPNQRFIVTFQPAAGGSPSVGELFYDDSGQPYRLHTILRQRSPGGRVAGDKRIGATNFLAAGMGSLWYGGLWYGIDYFNSDGRFSTGYPLYATGFGSSCNQDCSGSTCYPAFPGPCADVETAIAQAFALDPATLQQTPLSKAQDALYGRCCTSMVPGHVAAQMSNKNYLNRFGGDLAGLDDGNFVCVVDDVTGFLGGTANQFQTVAVIFRPDGSVVKEPWLVDLNEIWSNVAAYRGGFCIRVQTTFYFFDNAGNPTATNTVASSGMGFSTDRGDGTRIASDIRSHYVYLAGPITNASAVGLGIWDGWTGAFVTNAVVTDTDPSVTTVDRVNLAADAVDRVCVAYATKPDRTTFPNLQIAARLMQFDGANVTFLTPSFFPFVSHDSDPSAILGYVTINPSVAMTTKQICIAGKGTLNALNDPTGGPTTAPETTVYAVIKQPGFVPGGVESVGLTNIVPDVLLWYDAQGYYTNGPVIMGEQVTNNPPGSSWEPYISVMGDSTFLVEANTFADDGMAGPSGNMRYTVALQPAAGGPARIGEAFYADDGTPYRGPINLSRQSGNSGRVAGDKRYGATTFITGCEISPHGFTDQFNSDGRFDPGVPLYATHPTCRYGCSQVFSLNPATLAQTMLCLALDVANGRIPYSTPTRTDLDMTRFGGDVIGLDNGNFVAVVEDRSGIRSSGRAIVATIIAPDGSIVRDTFRVGSGADDQIWANVAAFRGGFCVRIPPGLMYFFDNNGDPLSWSPVNQTTSSLPFDTGRGDGTRIASDIRSYYLYLAGKTPETGLGHVPVSLAIWDTRSGDFVTSATVTDTDVTQHQVDRVNLAVDALDRVCVVYGLVPNTNAFKAGKQQIAARVLQFDGRNVAFLTDSFFPFVNHDSSGAQTQLGFYISNPSVAMTTEYICIAGKGLVNSTNQPASGPDTADLTALYTVISHPAPVPPPRPQMRLSRTEEHATISWPAETGFFRLQVTSALGPASWSDVDPQPPIAQLGDTFQMTIEIGSGHAFFRLAR